MNKNLKPTKAKNFLVYWHRSANSGVWEFDSSVEAIKTAERFAEVEDFYSVVFYDTLRQEKVIFRGAK